MNLIEALQDLMSQVPLLVQPLIVAAAAAIPFVEGELASVLGVWAGLNPFVAFAAAVTGNFLSVFVVVVFGARIRAAIVAARARRRAPERVPAMVGASGSDAAPLVEPDQPEASATSAKAESKGRQRFRRFLVRFGVPGASILGPLALPTQITSAMLVASGVSKGWILLWQAVAIVLWTAFTTAVSVGVITLVAG
ncbi:small multidrug efflux protein [Agromyces sp. LHK192]|uniref:small multidrug efflux protein n=1 Tax=Agromyces sp. LHK192 TaxID=2498704 RepID=UPI00196AC665|nr:small multidrug efflux protein [Agromyces sp. LHK192]